MTAAYIVDALRTAGGCRNGALRDWHPADMGAAVIDALMSKSGIDPSAVEDVIVGCVSQVGEQSFHVGRSMVLASSLPETVPAVTIDRQCGSSQQALHFAAQAVMSGTQDIVLAAGVEHMTRVPMGTPTMLAVQAGLGKGPWSDALLEKFSVTEFSQFTGAQMIADRYGFTREQLDAFALESQRRAAAATDSGVFTDEIVPLGIIDADGNETLHTRDEGIRRDASMEGLAALKTIKPGGVITAGNASQICDGASGVLIVNERALKAHGLTPIARIDNLTVTAGDPVIMLMEPIPCDAPRARAIGPEDRRYRSVRSERGLCAGPARMAQGNRRRSGPPQCQWRRDCAWPSARGVGNQADGHARPCIEGAR